QDDATDVIERVPINRHSRVAGLLKHFQHLDWAHSGIEGFDLCARNHNALDGGFGEIENVVDQLPLIFDQVTALVTERDQMSQLLFAVGRAVLGGPAQSKQSKTQQARFVYQQDRRFEDSIEDLDRASDCKRNSLSSLKRERLGYKFAEQQMQISHNRQRNRCRD